MNKSIIISTATSTDGHRVASTNCQRLLWRRLIDLDHRQLQQAVNVTGTPELALNSGGTASYASGSGTRR